MFCSIRMSSCALLLLCLVGLVCVSGCRSYGRSRTWSGTAGTPPTVGIRVLEVFKDGNAERAGLKPMDVISKYGDYDIVDDATFFAARDAYAPSLRQVQLEVWRGRVRLTPTMPSGRLGIQSNEYNPVMYKFWSIMQKLDARREIPLYQRDHEFKDEFTTPDAKILEQARGVIDQGVRDGSITATQVLVSQIYMIRDDASPEDLKRLSQLLSQFLSTQPDAYVEYLGHDIFFEKKRYRAAREFFKQHLKTVPDDVSTWLNLGVVCNDLGLFDEAEAAADHVADNGLSLANYGMVVFYNVKARAALGKRDYARSIGYAEKVFTVHHQRYEIAIVQLAAAQVGDLEKLAEANRKFQQFLPAEYEQKGYQVDAVEAFALAKANQRDRARQLVLKWKDDDRVELKVAEYWGSLPGGGSVAENWRSLAGKVRAD